MSNKLAIAISDRLFSSCAFSRILYQKALTIAELSLEEMMPLQSDRCWNKLNYYDFSLNNLVKQGKICSKIPQGVSATFQERLKVTTF
ncbi:MAG: hypothetical protein ACYTXC_20215 [Nostoc sp.]